MAWFESIEHEGGDTLLCVGRFDGRVFEALRSDEWILAAGPRGGQVIAWWPDGLRGRDRTRPHDESSR